MPPTEIPTASPATPTPTAVASPTATAIPPDGVTLGGIARFAIKESPAHQDVHQSISPVIAAWGAGLAYSRLFTIQRGSNVPVPSLIPECDLCESWKQSGPLEFQFDIRDDVYWPNVPPVNGRKVTAKDIAYSYTRLTAQGSPNADLIPGLEEVEAIGDRTLLIRLSRPDAEIFQQLANARAVIVAEEVVSQHGHLLQGPTIGTGPWVLEEISPESATFETNRSYYGNGPLLDGLAVQFIAADSTRAAGVRADILDFAQTSQVEIASALERFPDLGTASIPVHGTGVEMAINSTRTPLDSKAIRQAIMLSWDLAAMRAEVWGEEHSGPSAGLVVPDPGWSTSFDDRYSGMFGDAEKASGMVADAGLTTDDSISITVGKFGEVGDRDRYVRTAESLADALNAAGMSVTVNTVTTRLFADEVWLAGDYDIFIGAPPPVSSLNGQLFGIYHSDGPWNTTGFSSAKLDGLIEAQSGLLDRTARGELVLDIQDEIMAQAQRFFPTTGTQHWLWQPRVQDFVPDTTGDSGDFLRRIWLSRN